MVLKKRIYYGGFHGLLPPVIPKAPRSLRVRRRSLNQKTRENGGEICAFELLAAVAGKLLQESESSTSSIDILKEGVDHEQLEVKVDPVKSEHHDQESGVESELVAQPTNLHPVLNKSPQIENDSGSDHASIVTTSNFIKEIANSSTIETFENKSGINDTSGKPENICDVSFGDNYPKAMEKQKKGLTRVPKKSNRDGHLSFYRDPVHINCSSRHRGIVVNNNNNNNNIRDDDEKYFSYSKCSTRRRVFGSRPRTGYKRVRKMLSSKYWKASSKINEYQFADTTSGVRSLYQKRKSIYTRERFQADVASKKRKLFQHSSKTAYIKEASSESMSNSVKFSIKSFKVPELYVAVPETATVGSLKRSVMEAVTAILQGQLHVGVLLRGKKVRDDNKTLQQTGISQNCNLESLGFTLEPSSPEGSSSLVQPETPLLLPCNTQQHLSRSPSSPITDGRFSNSSPGPPLSVTTLDDHIEKNEEGTTFPAEVTTQERVDDSKALVLVPPLDAEAICMVPLSDNKPSKRYEISQRRTRRPFSVTEVEALVEAVEILGAGRWRDVKMRAFDDADHRTYVDLKDKWKTLVHTASIGPQQRRGEPVPQDLLDRVLAAHAYWSQQQSKQQHMKNHKTFGSPL